MEYPVYFVNGFLDSGKTTFINGFLEDGFAHDAATLLIRCEDGEEEISNQAMYNVAMVEVARYEELNTEFFKNLEKKHKFRQVVIEWNGMWPMTKLCNEILPENWIVYQVMVFIDATTFEMYTRNMGQLMMEKVINADLIVFNRCDAELKAQLRSRNLRMVNRQADIFLEEGEESEEYINDETPPFDMSGDILTVDDADFGVLYVDMMDYPDRYVGKKIALNAVMCHSQTFAGTLVLGRFAMVCCEDDIKYLGCLAHGEGLDQYPDYQWLSVVATVGIEEHEAYQGKGPVLLVESAIPGEKPEDDVVNF